MNSDLSNFHLDQPKLLPLTNSSSLLYHYLDNFLDWDLHSLEFVETIYSSV